MRRRALAAVAATAFLALGTTARAQQCDGAPLQLQFLGSGPADVATGRGAPALLLWVDGKARVLIDAGPGTALRYTRSGADIADLDAVLLTNLRVERSGDLPAVLQLAVASGRKRALPVYGPAGNRWMPSTVTFVRTLFDPTRGAWRHVGDVLSPLTRNAYKLEPHDLRPARRGMTRDNHDDIRVFERNRLRVSALALDEERTPSLAWRIEGHGKHVAVSGTSARRDEQARFLKGADTLVAARITVDVGQLTADAKAKQLLLSAAPDAARETESMEKIRQHYDGPVLLANDLDCVTP